MQGDNRIRRLEYIDWNSPGTMLPDRGERPQERAAPEVDIGDDSPAEIVEIAKRIGYRSAETELLPADRFSNEPAAEWQCRLMRSPTSTESIRERSKSVSFRLALSCSGWKRRPTAEEFYQAVRAEPPTERHKAILDTWVTEAEWHELLAAWTEHAYTFRELAEALHRAGLARCHAAAALNLWALYPMTPERND